MTPDKKMIIEYCCEDIQFEVTFGPHKDLYAAAFKVSFNNITLSSILIFEFCFQKDNNKLLLPLNISTYILGE